MTGTKTRVTSINVIHNLFHRLRMPRASVLTAAAIKRIFTTIGFGEFGLSISKETLRPSGTPLKEGNSPQSFKVNHISKSLQVSTVALKNQTALILLLLNLKQFKILLISEEK